MKKLTYVALFILAIASGSIFNLIIRHPNKRLNYVEVPKLKSIELVGNNYNSSPQPTIVEFVDYECGPCKMVSSFLHELESKKEINLVIRHFPLKFHKNAYKYAIISESSRNSGFFLIYIIR